MYGGIKYQQDGNLFEQSSPYFNNNNNKQITNELWRFDLEKRKWKLLNSNDTLNADLNKETLKNYMLPIGVAGHSMALVKSPSKNSQSLFVFLGFSEYYGATLNIIQEYDLSMSIF